MNEYLNSLKQPREPIIELGTLLRSYKPASLPKTTLAQVAGCLKNRYQGKAKTIEEMDTAIAQGIRNSWI